MVLIDVLNFIAALASITAQTKHETLMDETSQLGFMLASKSIVQLMFNPVVGPLTQKYVKQLWIWLLLLSK